MPKHLTPALALLVSSLWASPALAEGPDLSGAWETDGQLSSRGATHGRVELTRAGGARYTISGRYALTGGAPLTFSGTAVRAGARLYVRVRFAVPGMGGALEGRSARAGWGHYMIGDDRLEGGWSSGDLRAQDTWSRAADSGPSPEELAAARADLDRIEQLLEGHTDRHEEAEIIGILRSASPERLSWLLENAELHELIDDVDDRVIGPDNRKALLRLLSRERLDDLTVPARAALIDALQRGHTGGSAERTVKDVLLGTRGADLRELKDRVDAGGDHRDLQQLLWHDLDDDAAREAILAHFAQEAQSDPERGRELKVLSDIDDTLYPNLKDSRYPGHAAYPGVRAFYAALDRAVLGADLRTPASDASEVGDLAFVTARPGDRAGVIEHLTHGTLDGMGLEHAVVLAGGFSSLIGNQRIAARKYENFLDYKALYPERRFVFVGDNGQGDAIFGARMRSEHPEAVPAVFIHAVVPATEADRAAWRGQGVHLFDTYAGAAVTANTLNLISDRALRDVCLAATRELSAIRFSDAAKREARLAELRADVERANARLPTALRVPLP